MARVKVFSVIMIILTFFSAVFAPGVVATGGADEGVSPSGGSCNYDSNVYWWDTCFGRSWQAYEVKKDLPSSDTVRFHYTNQTGGPVYLHYCKKGQTLYNYGFEVHAGNSSAGYQVSTQTNKEGTQAKWRSSGALGAFTGSLNTTGAYLQVKGYANQSIVKNKYDDMVAYDEEHGTNYTHDTTWDSVGYFCFDPDVEKKALTAYAVTEFKEEGGKGYHKYLTTSGTVSDWLESAPNNAYTVSSGLVKYGSSASVTVDNSKGDYEFGGWGSSCGDEPGETADNANRKCTVNALNNNKNVYAYYNAVSLFMGDSSVAEVSEDNKGIGWNDIPESKKRYTNWQSESKLNTPTYVVNNCDPEKGCWVSFRHYLKRMSGTGSTKFSIERELGDGVGWTIHNFTTTSGENVAANPVKMYPGQKLCETLSFYAKSDSGANVKGNVVQTRICAAAVATVGADIDIQIRDQRSSDRYNEYGKSDIVYAKPTDTVNIKGSYSPKYQSLYDTVLPKGATVNSREISNNNGTKIGNMFSLYNNPAWNNAFSINLFYDEKDLGKNCDDKNYYNGTVGSADKYDGVADYQVMHNDVGKTKKAKAVTNICEPVKNTPKQVLLTYSDSASFTANVDVGDKRSKEVSIAVPYNFSNSTEITNAQGSVVYAGEAASINYNITVGTKNNSETNGEYATPVPGAEWGLSMSYDGGATWDDVKLGSGDLNSGNEYKFEGGKEPKGGIEGKTVNIPDLPAGTVIYFRSWVTPGDSGDPINMDVGKFSGKVYSKEVSFIVAKRPSFQVWGGNIYSAKDVGLSMSVKNNLADEADYPYNMTGGDKVRVFGSWAELSLVAEGEIKGLSSGAGLGYGTTTDAGNASQQKTIKTLGGRDSSDYCLMSTLSIENDNCKSYVGNLGRSSGRSGDKSSLLSDFTEEIGTNYRVIDFGSDGFVLRERIGELDDFSGEEISEDGNTRVLTTKVIRTKGDVVIDKNIIYDNDGRNTTEGYSNLESIPKIIIYAENINISCSVTRVDAVLIADKNINTCDGKKNNEDVNLEARSKQLVINGSVISNALTLGRTYGAATGKNSVIPAEIINYDTSLYLWANNQSSATTSGKLTETYINELAPRY